MAKMTYHALHALLKSLSYSKDVYYFSYKSSSHLLQIMSLSFLQNVYIPWSQNASFLSLELKKILKNVAVSTCIMIF